MKLDVETRTPFKFHIGNYCLYQTLKRGVHSTIYVGEHIYLHNRIIMKVLNNWIADKLHIDNFSTEVWLHSSLHHPHIVRVLDFGIQGNIPFLVMDYASQGSLHEHLSTNVPLSLGQTLPFIKQITQALQYIHDRGLIHCDVKPQNILLDANNNVLLSDFGIALIAQSWKQIRSTSSFGTALYAAPEQIEGKPLIASDQYSLAILVYIWLCGQPPFTGNSLQLCKQHLYSEVPPLHNHIATIPPDVERVVMRALSKDPYQRYPSVSDFADALQTAANIHSLETAVSMKRAQRQQHQSLAQSDP